MGPAAPSRVRLGEFEVDLRAGELCKENCKVLLQEQPFQILLMLVERRGALVDREEIRKRLWPNDTIVEFDHSIHTAIKKLRQALGDSADNPQYVETVARRGYRLIVAVELYIEPVQASMHILPPATHPSSEPATAKGLSPSAALIGKRVSHYRVLGVLGGGGMGLLYWAEDIKLGRSVALKFLPEELAGDPVALERFEREARAMSALDHPNICAVHEFGEQDGRHFIVMPLLEGKTLRDQIGSAEKKNSPFSTHELVGLALQIADGLTAAHRQGIIHRDIKPSNIFVTDSGTVKILDFGLAKRASIATEAESESAGTSQANFPHTNITVHATLTRFGVALGTAAYMSPEQVRGEPLDARTDLFSFGLVLYEMATGHQAFEGATVAIVNEAILNRSQVPVRELNPGVSPDLERIINKALEKDRALRYQSAAEMRAELSRLQDKGHPLRWVPAGAAAFALLAFVFFWSGRRKQTVQPEIRETQITANSGDLSVGGNAISPDGKYLAYSDWKGIHLKVLATGEIKTLTENAYEEYFAWFPDSTRFLASRVSGDGIREYSVTGGPPRLFLSEGAVSGVSPDGSLVSYTTHRGHMGDREIWFIGSDGTNPRLFFSVGEDATLQEPYWTPDGRRISYQMAQETADGVECTVETRDLQGGSRVVLYSSRSQNMEDMGVQDLVWLSGGRLILSLSRSDGTGESFSTHCNLWELLVDPATGQPLGTMRRLTNWPGGSVTTALYATADGKKISALRMASSAVIYLADFARDGKHISAPRLFTPTEGINHAPAWSQDSQTLFFESNRNGRVQIFRQPISSAIAQPVSLESPGSGLPTVSPDGSFLLYTAAAHDPKAGSLTPVQIMRAPLNGGAPQPVLTARIYDMPRCARAPTAFCAIAEPAEDQKQIIFTAFDPVQGRGHELTRFDVDPNADYAWDLSPNGQQIAVLKRIPSSDGKIFRAGGPIHVLSLTGQPPRNVRAKGWDYFHEFVDWASDGKGVLVTVPSESYELLRVDLDGNATVLWSEKGAYSFRAVPSPDGRHLAILRRSSNNNVWLLENF